MAEPLAAITWAVERNAERFPRIPGRSRFRDLRVAKTLDLRDRPEFWILFTVDSQEVATLRYIEALTPAEGAEDRSS